MRFASIPLACAFLLAVAPTQVYTQAARSAEPFYVGTFEIDGAPTVGLILRDRLVVEIEEANDNLHQDPAVPEMAMPEDILQLIGLYENGLRSQLYEIVNHFVGEGMLEGSGRPGFLQLDEAVRKRVD